MSPRTKLILIFAGKALGFLIVLSLLWHFFLAEPYNRALVGITDSVSGVEIMLGEDFEEDVRQELGLKEGNIYIAVWQPWGLELHGHLEGSALHYGMLLVISLIAATPGLGWKRRLKFIGIALVIMFALHLITILIFAQIALSGAYVSRNPVIILFITLGTALFPALIWGALCYKYWWPKGVVGG